MVVPHIFLGEPFGADGRHTDRIGLRGRELSSGTAPVVGTDFSATSAIGFPVARSRRNNWPRFVVCNTPGIVPPLPSGTSTSAG